MSSYKEIDPQIIESAKTSEDAFIQLYQHYGQRVLRFLISRTRSVEVAEDLTQETFITVLSKLNTYSDTGAKFSSWLLQVAMNHARMHFRQQGNKEPENLDSMLDLIPEGKNYQTEWMDFFLGLDKLSDEEQNILLMKYVEDMSNQEIAETMQISPNTCGVQLHRALKQLQQYL